MENSNVTTLVPKDKKGKKETTLTEATWIEKNPLDEQKLLRW